MFACAPGLGAFDLLKDETMMPMRGQLISVRAFFRVFLTSIDKIRELNVVQIIY